MVIPWYAKIAAKLMLSRLPVPYPVWRRLGLFRHGAMQTFEYAFDVFRQHLETSGVSTREGVLELGPGDSVFTALLAHAAGFRSIYLVDVAPCASADVEHVKAFARWLETKGLNAPDLRHCCRIQDILETCHAFYLTEGLASLRQIPSASLDLVFSQAVLEHVRYADFAATLHELHRILKPDGVSTHVIDLTDHLGGGLHHLRFPAHIWEHEGMAQSGFYTNRLRSGQILQLFREQGFSAELVRVQRWPNCPIARDKLAPVFRSLPEAELTISGLTLKARPVEDGKIGVLKDVNNCCSS